MDLNSKISVNNIEKYKSITITPTSAELVTLAKYLDVLRILKLLAILKLKKQDIYILLEGNINATIIQECGLSGEELTININVPLERTFIHQYKNLKIDKTLSKIIKEPNISLENDEVEILPTHEISCFQIVAETLILEIDPFIKKGEYKILEN